jgi:uncharacterized membrane protein (DUF485 family)
MNKTTKYVVFGVSVLALAFVGSKLYVWFKDRNYEKIQEGSFEIVVK